METIYTILMQVILVLALIQWHKENVGEDSYNEIWEAY